MVYGVEDLYTINACINFVFFLEIKEFHEGESIVGDRWGIQEQLAASVCG